MAEITPALLRQLLFYEPDTGRLFWKERPPALFGTGNKHRSPELYARHWNSRWAGAEAMTAKHKHGYRYGMVKNVRLYAHRVAWAIHYGTWPTCGLDHIDGDPANNRIANLREATQAQNVRNAARRRDNTSGVTGVYWIERLGVWRADIRVNRRSIYLGCFATIEGAIAARKAAEARHRFHPNHGRST